jgi:hypothetical protein
MKRKLRLRSANPRPKKMSLTDPVTCDERTVMRRPDDDKELTTPAAYALHAHANKNAPLDDR